MPDQVQNEQHHMSFEVTNPSDPQTTSNGQSHDVQKSPNTIRNDSLGGDGPFREQYTEHPPQYDPPPIDFTGYQIDRQMQVSTHSQQHLAPPTFHDQSSTSQPESQNRHISFQSSITRKRSHSNTDPDEPTPPTPDSARPNRLSSISSILNPTQRQDEMPIDPSLSVLGQQALRQSQIPRESHHKQQEPLRDQRSRKPSNLEASEQLAQRKARLRQEAEEMRTMLRAKERELEELDGEG
ncbi:MAG: hypothetical protein L6R40_007930 [Gallowayella cf. fulva]|nr:MAG: hypothetical protein L6R40_007930 [Xanthomendoza cf. fulva]